MSTGEITTFDELQLALKKYMHKKEIAKINLTVYFWLNQGGELKNE